jgi:aspartyl-tRNA(Asn)/glutamyl-tRNA(Gln) amidotransferase subunit B
MCLVFKRPSRIFPTKSTTRALSSWTCDLETGLISSKKKDTPLFQTIIGLEIHAQLDISTKLLSGSNLPKSVFQAPNTCVWPFDVATPGFLPRLSREAVHAAVLTAAATKCNIPYISRFERKHYFYADSPLGYQVTQQRWPLAKDGVLVCRKEPKGKKKKKTTADHDEFSVRIERIQLEQDTGKTIMTTRQGETESLVDFNRAGSALIEIVFHPDLRSASDAATTVETLRNLLRHIGACDGKMEEGSLRCDLNVSIAPVYVSEEEVDLLEYAGNRVEVKNLNSLRQVLQAAEYEAVRQAEALVDGEPTSQETRTFDVKTGKTVVLRTKGGAKDYRFLPEPDLPPIVLDPEMFGGQDLATFLAKILPELPDDARKRLKNEYHLSDYLTGVLTSDPPAIKMFDEAVQSAREHVGEKIHSRVPETVANFLSNELFSLVRDSASQKSQEEAGSAGSIQHSTVNGQQLGGLVALVLEGEISNTMAKQILNILYHEEQGKSPREVAGDRGFKLITDPEELAKICREVITNNPKELERYKMGGKFARKITKLFIGKAMAASRANAHPERLNEVLRDVLDEVAPDVDK